MRTSSGPKSSRPSRLFSLLSSFSLFRRLVGGSWQKVEGVWLQATETTDPTDLTDNFCLRKEIQEFLSLCEKENQRERT